MVFFFFFQAEDGIRGLYVTGVQTCALPISLGPSIAASIPLVVTTQSKAFKNPEAWAWNFTVEREMFWKTLLSVAYVARRGVHLQRESDINQPTTAVAAAHPCLEI